MPWNVPAWKPTFHITVKARDLFTCWHRIFVLGLHFALDWRPTIFTLGAFTPWPLYRIYILPLHNVSQIKELLSFPSMRTMFEIVPKKRKEQFLHIVLQIMQVILFACWNFLSNLNLFPLYLAACFDRFDWSGSWQCDRVYTGFLQPESKPSGKSLLSCQKPHSGATAAGGRYVPSETPPRHRHHAHCWTGGRLLHWEDLNSQVGGVMRSRNVNAKVSYVCSGESMWFISCREVAL